MVIFNASSYNIIQYLNCMCTDCFLPPLNRRMFGARKLWDAKDDQAWVHDRFEEMNLHDDRYEVIAQGP